MHRRASTGVWVLSERGVGGGAALGLLIPAHVMMYSVSPCRPFSFCLNACTTGKLRMRKCFSSDSLQILLTVRNLKIIRQNIYVICHKYRGRKPEQSLIPEACIWIKSKVYTQRKLFHLMSWDGVRLSDTDRKQRLPDNHRLLKRLIDCIRGHRKWKVLITRITHQLIVGGDEQFQSRQTQKQRSLVLL